MVKVENHLGTINISTEYLSELIGHTVTNCFGVVSMNPYGTKQGILSLIKKNNSIDKGVIIRQSREKLEIDLHITVSFGVNISAVVDSIVNKVTYTIKEAADISIIKVNVFIDGMNS